ncbi:uncharacterized protein LOC135844926 [Planococcus citri]|uniref:uncharacterized protein LOC135844926 n=1 Tax=Planococcus citri TaxID=170843 RepID=UPI0031FA3DBE
METVGIDLDNKYTYFPPFPRLEDLAGLSLVLNLWNYYYSHYHDTDSCDDDLEKVNEMINDMKMPNCIKEKMIDLCETIDRHLDHNRYGREDMMNMCNYLGNKKHFFLYGAAWDTNGHINDKKTAQKVLKCPERLNDNDLMFRIMVKYCLENDIKDFPLSSLSEKFYEKSRFTIRDELTDYWIEFKVNERTGRHQRHYQRMLLDSLKRNTRFFCPRPMHVYEYFWYFLDENEQVTITRNLIQHVRSDSMFFLFSKLNRHQLRSLYLEEPAAIIANYFYSEDFKLVNAAWARVRSTIKEEEFERLIYKILHSEIFRKDDNIQYLIDMWNNAPDNLIEYVINVKNCEITSTLFPNESKYSYEYYVKSSSFKFLKFILLQTTIEFRKQFLVDKGLPLILNYSDVFSSLIEHCLDATDQMETKEMVLIKAIESENTEILRRFRDLLYSSVNEFYEFLEFFTLEPNLQMRVKKRLLRSGVLIIGKLNRVDNWAKICQFIDELYSNDEKEARRQKNKTVKSFLHSHFYYGYCFRRNGDENFTEIENLMTQFLTAEEIATAKEDIIDYFQSVFCSDTVWHRPDLLSKRVNILKLTAWCYDGDEERMSQFKRSFPIDKAFQHFLREAVERYVNGRDADLSFSPLDQLLCWKFSSKKYIKKFKRRQIHHVMKSELFAYFICKKEIHPFVVKKIIAWIFDDNEFKIEEFEQLYQEEISIKIIHWLNPRKDCSVCREYTYHSSDESD